MKRLLLFVGFINILSLCSHAQDSSSRPFIEEGKTWVYEVSNPNSNPYYYEEWTETFQLTGDTLINSHNCKKLYHSRTGSKWQPELDLLYGGALFEDEGKVYIVYPKGQALQLLYDFSCKKGDSRVIGGYELEILEKLNVSYAGLPLHILIWSPKEMDQLQYNSILVEGIGSPDNDLIHYYDEWLPDSYRYKLLSCNVNGTEIFNYDIFQEVYSSIYHAYRPLFEEGKVWVSCESQNWRDEFNYSVSFFINGDTVINNHNCKKMWMQQQLFKNTTASYHFACYEDHGKVYLYFQNYPRPRLLCDFNAEVGDTIITDSLLAQLPHPRGLWVVTKIDSIDVNNQLRKRLYVSGEGNRKDIWVEGIGCKLLWDGSHSTDNVFLSCIINGKETFIRRDFERTAASETYHPLLESGKVWHQSYKNLRQPELSYEFSYSLVDDTIISGIKRYKLYGHNLDNKGTDQYLALLIEFNKQVHILWTTNDFKSPLLYDFNLSIGEKFQHILGRNSACGAPKDYVEAYGVRRHCIGMEYKEQKTGYIGCWVEGIGSNASFYDSYRWTPSMYLRLDSCTLNGKVLFTHDDFPVLPSQEIKMEKAAYHPMFSEGKRWNYINQTWDRTTDKTIRTPVSYVVRGDSLLDGKKYVKLFYESSDTSYVHSLWRETNQIIFCLRDGTEELFFDYGAPYHGEVAKNLFLEGTEIINVNGTLFTRYRTLSTWFEYGGIWIDGIGSSNGIINPNGIITTNGDGLLFSSCEEHGKVIFTNDDVNSTSVTYRPFIEEGKVWRTGIQPGNDYVQQFEYKFYNDTIIGGKTCKVLGKSKLEYYSPEKSYLTLDTTYVGVLYEENGKVYRVNPENEEFTLIYDFISPVGMDITVLGEPLTIARREKSQEPEFKGIVTELQSTDDERSVVSWMEGVGCRSNPLESLASLFVTGLMNEILISCSIDNGEIIFLKEESLPYPSEVKKKWLDFTHVVKPKPKSPQRVSASKEDASEEGASTSDEASEQEMLTGEYSARELFVSLKTLTGAYTVTLTDAAGEVVYRKDVQTSNVVALNTLLTDYPDGEYTLTVENAEEQYTALLSLPLVDDAVRDLLDDKSVNSKSVNGKWSDLSGRHLNSQPIRKGIYIKDGRKVLIK